MSDASATPDTTKPDAAHYQRVLAAMVDLAAAVAQKLAARIDDATPAEAADLAGAFERIARAVRRTIFLSTHLDKAAEKAAATRATARARIIREVSDAISRKNLPAASAETLRVELVERLDAPDLSPELDREILSRPIPDIILDLKRDMGLAHLPGTPPWPRRTPDDIADLLARAQKPTQPWPPTPWQTPPPNAPS
jgi:hypothetical protein